MALGLAASSVVGSRSAASVEEFGPLRDDLLLLDTTAGPVDIERLIDGLGLTPTAASPAQRLAAVSSSGSAPATYRGIAPQPGKPGLLSGLPWQSGASCGGPAFAAWRGRPQDVHTGWAPRTTWAAFTNFSARLSRFSADDQFLSLGIPMLMNGNKGQFDQCTGGAFDRYHRQFAADLVRHGLGDSMIRLGWEANGDWYPWSIGSQVDAYKSCFRRLAGIYKSASANLKIEWVMSKKGKSHPTLKAYPGDDVVDHIGAHFYDRFPTHKTQVIWDQQLNAYIKPQLFGTGSPWGIGSWYSFARSRGKFFTASEWGINDGYPPDGFDNPLHIRNMYAWFKAHAAGLAYETYYNCYNSNHQYTIFPSQYNPKASAAYLELWKAGQ